MAAPEGQAYGVRPRGQGRADTAVHEGRLSDASRILEEAIAAPPTGRSPSTTARLLVSLAEIRDIQGRGAEAIRLSEQALATVKGSDHSIVLLAGLVMIKADAPLRRSTWPPSSQKSILRRE